MPFIGRDWRSPGEAWVKTEEGSWERLKILENSTFGPKTEQEPQRFNLHHDQSGFHSSGDSSTESDSDNESSGGSDEGSPRNSVERCMSSDDSEASPGTSPPLSDVPSTGLVSRSNSNTSQTTHWQPPYCHITIKSTKEVAGYNTISEAFYKLDFCNAIRDIRRFNYICKLLHLLITQNLTSLSGCATKALFNMLEQVAWQVASNQQNMHILHTLLYDLKKIMKKYYCWGRPLGSTLLWEHHLRTIEKICQMANTIEIKGPINDGTKRIMDLPEELIREILLRLSDYKDLMNSGQSCEVMQSLLDEQHIWRQLCKYHFTRQQVRQATPAYTKPEGLDWEQLFHHLRRKFGLKEEYADCLFLCRHCRCLFWKSFGHPCVVFPDLTVDEPKSMNGSDNPEDAHNGNNQQPAVDKIPQQQQQQQGEGPQQGQPQVQVVNEEKFVDLSVPDNIPVPPQAFLKFFSL